MMISKNIALNKFHRLILSKMQCSLLFGHNISEQNRKQAKTGVYKRSKSQLCFIQNHYKYSYQKIAQMKTEIASTQETLDFFKQKYGNKSRRVYGYYSSQFDKIVTEQHLMLIPIDERMATRAHGVFDVIYLIKMKLINISSHVKRLVKSAKNVGVHPQDIQFGQKKKQGQLKQDEICQFLQQKIESVINSILNKLKSQKNMSQEELFNIVMGIRLSISSGHGDFGIASLGKKPVFYIYAFEPYINYKQERQGVNEFVVKRISKINTDMVHTKSLNYFQNAMMANQSKKLGGYQGIKALQNGVLLQAAVANIFFIFGKEFATPRFETVIEGTTIKRLLSYLQRLKQEGVIDKISFRDITIQEVQSSADQMAVIGGDKIVPVLNFNGKKIRQKKGPIVSLCQQWYEKQIDQSADNRIINLD